MFSPAWHLIRTGKDFSHWGTFNSYSTVVAAVAFRLKVNTTRGILPQFIHLKCNKPRFIDVLALYFVWWKLKNSC